MLGKRVETARTSLGWKQHELAEKMGISQQAIQKIEDGRTKMPRDIDKLAKTLEVSVEWLITGRNSPVLNIESDEQDIESKSIIELLSFLTSTQKQSAIEFMKKFKSQNEQVFSELSGKMTAQRRIEQLSGDNNHAHA